ncbi:MAG TPA: hypothetical protein VN181_05750, partial [Thermoanaerobaculia bacterium]|nr:hypothetical protein [Thermoanaerobaculia bacterium]
VISRADAGPSLVTLTFSYFDNHVFSVAVQRATGGNPNNPQFSTIGNVSACTSGPRTFIDYGGGSPQTGGKLTPGTWQYRLVATNDGSVAGLNGIPSDIATVTVGSAPQIVNFTASPSTVRLGRDATLTFSTRGATSVSIEPGVGAFPLSGSVTVTPTKTTTYTLTATNGALVTTARVTVVVITDPQVAVSQFPNALVQTAGIGGATTSYVLTNAGGASTSIQLSPLGQFFTQSPTFFTLAPGASQRVQITGLAQSATNVFEGASIVSGVGVPQGLRVPIRLLSAAPPPGSVIAKPVASRIDTAGPFGASPTGNVTFRNNGTAPLVGVLVADVPWITPQGGLVTIPPLGTATFSFTIDRSKRLDDSAVGSAVGNIKLVYPPGSGSGSRQGVNADPLPSVSIVSVVDTTSTTVTNGAPPALSTGEVALFIPGVGHVTGSVGVFISDVSILNRISGASINDMKLFYTPVGAATTATKTTTLPPVGGSVSVALADVVSTTFGTETQVGSLQIRSNDASRLSVSTNIFNKSNPAGTYGTAIPTFRSDRAVGPGANLVLTGLKRDGTTHTNLFIQETAGITTTVATEFLDVNGTTIGNRSDTVGPFSLLQINSVVPVGGVAAIMTNTGGSGAGRFLAYATPVDEASGDNWSVADWSKVNGYSQTEAVVIPVAGSVAGALSTFFRTDLAITNTSSSAGSALL